MDRSKLADLSEIVSSIAIVVTLIYLVVEIRQNTNALNSQSRQAVMEAAKNELFALIENPDLTISMIKTEPLTSEEQIRLDSYYAATLRNREFSWLQFQDGTVDELQWETELSVLSSIFDTSRSRDWWDKIGRHVFGPQFVSYVDEILEQQEPTNTIWQSSENWASRKNYAEIDSSE